MSDDHYLYVRQARPDLYQEIVAFSSTVNLRDDLQTRASIEKFCMHLVDACKYALAIILVFLSLLFTGVVEAKEVIIPYDDFLKIMASKEYSDKLKNQCAAKEAIYVKLEDENKTVKKLNADLIQSLEDEADTRRRLGETQEQINAALEKQLNKVTADLDAEKSKKYWWAGGSAISSAAIVTAIFLWVVN